MSERTKKIVELFKSARPRKKSGPPPGPTQTIIGDGNIQVAGDLKINTKKVYQHKFTKN